MRARAPVGATGPCRSWQLCRSKVRVLVSYQERGGVQLGFSGRQGQSQKGTDQRLPSENVRLSRAPPLNMEWPPS